MACFYHGDVLLSMWTVGGDGVAASKRHGVESDGDFVRFDGCFWTRTVVDRVDWATWRENICLKKRFTVVCKTGK
jgi:hypothetical protein